MNKKIFLLSLSYMLHSLGMLSLNFNPGCPAEEKVEPVQLFPHNNAFFCSIPEEIINKADKLDLITLKAGAYQSLAKEAYAEGIKRVAYANLAGKETKNLTSFLKDLSTSLHKISSEEVSVTEYDIVRMLPYLEFHAPINNNPFPIPYSILIKQSPTIFQGEESIIFEGYITYWQLLEKGWIRCNDKENNTSHEILWYRPRYFKMLDYYQKYGPRFREIINKDEKPYGSLWILYDFSQDPHYNFQKPSFLPNSF
jgi:hypothetical protein